MKKFLHIALLVVYLPAALGIGFNLHYCCGKLESVNVFSFNSKTCCCGGEVKSCCSDEQEYVKLDDNSQESSVPVVFNAKSFSNSLLVYPVVSTAHIVSISLKQRNPVFSDSGPPVHSGEPTYLQVRSILI